MKGIYFDAKAFRPLSDASYFMYSCNVLRKKTSEFVPVKKRIEIRSDDLSPSTYPDEPYLFSSILPRYYNYDYFYQNPARTYSLYTCVVHAHATESGLFSVYETPMDFMIIIMCKGAFVAGIYRERREDKTIELFNELFSEEDEKDFHSKIKNMLAEFKMENSPKFIRCRKEDFHLFGHNKNDEFGLPRHFHIPFVTNYPSLEELNRVEKQLFTCIRYKSIEECHEAEGKLSKIPLQRNLGAPKLAEKFILEDDGEELTNLLKEVQADGEKSKESAYFEDFISIGHSVTGNRCLLHFAVLNEKSEAIEVLLEFGCNPSVYDENNKSLYELCKTDKTRKIFVKMREKDGDEEYDEDSRWFKSKVPSAKDFKETTTPKQSKKDRRKERKAKKKAPLEIWSSEED